MAQSVNSLPHKHGDLSLDFQSPHKSQVPRKNPTLNFPCLQTAPLPAPLEITTLISSFMTPLSPWLGSCFHVSISQKPDPIQGSWQQPSSPSSVMVVILSVTTGQAGWSFFSIFCSPSVVTFTLKLCLFSGVISLISPLCVCRGVHTTREQLCSLLSLKFQPPVVNYLLDRI